MKLMTKALEERFAQVGHQENVKDPIVVSHFFYKWKNMHWFATEYDPKDKIFFGYVSLFGDHNDEWGSFSLDELERFKGPIGLSIERDLHFAETPSSELIKQYTHC